MTYAISLYLPQDRRDALVKGLSLPTRAEGAALFADISGFTRLTEQFTQQFGLRHGIEMLTEQINAVYDALISVVDSYEGSVISFAGGRVCA